jgi:hypothetical protein
MASEQAMTGAGHILTRHVLTGHILRARRAAAIVLLVPLMFLAACSGATATHTGNAAGNAGTGGRSTGTPGGTAAARNGQTATGAPAGSPGWPMKTQAYLGRYRMTWSSDRAFAQAAMLTLFMRHVTKPKEMILPSGILSAFGRDETTVLYITKLKHKGTHGSAEASAGNYTYTPVGLIDLIRFDPRHHTLSIRLDLSGDRQGGGFKSVAQSKHGGKPIELRFTRYSANPHP